MKHINTFKKQQKEDKKMFDSLMNEFTKEELAKMLIRCRRNKNKLLLQVKNEKA